LSNLPGIDPTVVANTGATDIRNLATGDDLATLLSDYNDAVMTLFLMVAATSSVTILGSVLVEWRSIKKAGEQSKAAVKPVEEKTEKEMEEA
jgi:hypothetical protein